MFDALLELRSSLVFINGSTEAMKYKTLKLL
jgi:hypothetical protein